MKRSDLAMPWDAVKNDAHRLQIIRSLFDSPLRSFDVTKNHADKLRGISDTTIDDYAADLMRQLELGEYVSSYYETGITAKQLDVILGVDLDSLAGFVGASVIRKYVSPLIQALNATKNTLKSLEHSKNLVEQADSLLMLSEDSQNQNLYELKAGEERGTIITKRFFNDATKIQFAPLYSAGFSLYRTYLHFLTQRKNVAQLYNDSIHTVIINTNLGRIALGGKGNDTYQGEFLMIIDIGGNDRYLMTEQTKMEAMKFPVRAIVDLGGDDLYSAGNYELGGAIFGTNILLDVAGNDTYLGGDFSIGSGVFGIGIVHDFAGNDHYSGKTCTQGAGFFGVGLLIDESGNDNYEAQAHCQGFGSTRGFGAIADKQGNDIYVASSPFQDFLRYESHFESFAQGAALGFRPIASGGIGIIADFKGNDSYLSDIYGQGTAYWYGLGALYDEDGDDRYQSYQYSQGAGVHLAHGILWDKNGDDVYISHGVSQGCGHDIAFGGILDESGDDSYLAESLSLGGGNANAVSLCIDEMGDDSYTARNSLNTMGFSDFRRNYGMIGIFADGGGKDYYGEPTRNNLTMKKSTFGIFADIELNKKSEVVKNEPALTPPDSLKEPLRSTIDSLFIQASAAPQKYQYNVEPARAVIIGMGAEALPFLADKLATESPRERLALDVMLPKMYDKDTVVVKKLLMDSLQSPIFETVAMSAAILGRKKVQESLPVFLELLNDKEWRVRALSAQQLGELGNKAAAAELAIALQDIHPYVRARTAFSIGQILPDNTIELLKSAFVDEAQIVRNSAVQSLKRQKFTKETIKTVFSDLVPEKMRQELTSVFSSIETSVDTADKQSPKEIAEIIVKQPKSVRMTLYMLLRLSATNLWINVLVECRKKKTELELLEILAVKTDKKTKRTKKQLSK
jgi:HEAT repeat protein